MPNFAFSRVQGQIAIGGKDKLGISENKTKSKFNCVTGRSVDSIPGACSPLSVLSCGAASPGDDTNAAAYANHVVFANTCAPPPFTFSRVPLQKVQPHQALQVITSIAQEGTDDVTPHSISAVSNEGRRRHMFPTFRSLLILRISPSSF